jgi:hypothetical protein
VNNYDILQISTCTTAKAKQVIDASPFYYHSHAPLEHELARGALP